MLILPQMDTCGTFAKFDLEKNLIKEFNYWYLIVRPDQSYLGTCVVATKDHYENLSDVPAPALAELAEISKQIETVAKSQFGAYLVQWYLFMFRQRHVHFHVCPRYKTDVQFAGLTWTDDQKNDPDVREVPASPQDLLDQIKNEYQKYAIR